ncbi:MAG: trigger factor [Mycoplasma sp.]|nr:trigger factor [Mycoplasma sp.]
MIEKIKDLKKSELKILINVDEQKWQKAQKKIFNQLSQNLSIKGFRKGQVPESIAKKHIDQKNVWIKAIDSLLDEHAKIAYDALDEKEDEIIDQPNYSIDAMTETQLRLAFIFPILPDFSNFKYKNLDLEFTPPIIKDEDVENEIKDILKSESKVVEKEEKIVANGDIAVIDFTGFIDNNEFDGNKGQNFELEIGSNRFIPGFETQLINKGLGDCEVEVTFPKEYHSKEVAGKNAKFQVNIKNIKTKITPELTPELIEKHAHGAKNEQEFKNAIKARLVNSKTIIQKQNYLTKALEIFKKQGDFVVPKIIVDKEARRQYDYLLNQLKKSNLTIENYLENLKISMDQFKKDIENDVTTKLLETFFLAKIAKLENIEVEEKDYERTYNQISTYLNISLEKAKEQYKKENMHTAILNEKIIDKLIEWSAPNNKSTTV